ncbi:TPA: tryptophan-rich sensory protein, partial [Enterococcus faecium]|uniref:tryptophan-rich sensory protein n=3 Tax=Enterococcus TaxID=1350 RepID=UPI00363FBDBE
LRNIFIAAIDITLLVIFLSVLMYQLWRHHRLAMWLMIPYYLWVLFATLLNYSIYFLN